MLPMRLKDKECEVCGKRSYLISSSLGVCVECLRSDPSSVEVALRKHRSERAKLGLPPEPPRHPQGISCNLCDLKCRIPEEGLGYCGLVKVRNGRILHLSGQPRSAVLEYYYDPHPTNCVASWFCPGATGLGYPKWALKRGCERGYVNLAVFYGACNHNCVFCQNWHYKYCTVSASPKVSVDELVSAAIDPRVTCICFFGGDPAPQILHALLVSREVIRKRGKGRVLRICWETNGHISQALLSKVVEYSLITGGIIKFDLKAWTPSLYKALTGVDRGSLYDNVRRVALAAKERSEVPLFTASTLLVPGYVDVFEVRMIARFLASIDPDIPYSLLAFHPDNRMRDLPPTSKKHAYEALKAAKDEGLNKVRVGNPWLLGDWY